MMNMNIKERDKVLFGNYDKDRYYMGGIAYFKNLDVDKLAFLLDNNFIDPDEAQNCAPSTQEFYDFMEDYPNFLAHGYAVSNERDDYRITIEGLSHHGELTTNEQEAFVDLCRHADEFDFRSGYCWYD